MTTAILSALSNLNQSLARLENSAEKAEKTIKAVKAAKGPQPDLFGLFSGPKAAPNGAPLAGSPMAGSPMTGSPMVDPGILARRLDNAIQKVEHILKEGRA